MGITGIMGHAQRTPARPIMQVTSRSHTSTNTIPSTSNSRTFIRTHILNPIIQITPTNLTNPMVPLLLYPPLPTYTHSLPPKARRISLKDSSMGPIRFRCRCRITMPEDR